MRMINIRCRLLVAASAIALVAALCGGRGVKVEVVVRGIEGRPLDEVRLAPDPLVAALEGATYGPSLKDVPLALGDVSSQALFG